MKLKLKPVVKYCPAGEKYIFKRGVATVPGFKLCGVPIRITLNEFKKLRVEP